MDQTTKAIDVINRFLVPKLAQDFDVTKNHPEFAIREKYIKEHFQYIVRLVADLKLRRHPQSSVLIASFMILYEELKSEGPWSSYHCKQYAQKMDCAFDAMYSVSLGRMLHTIVFNAQNIFDQCMKILHQKLTPNDYRRYPGLVEVYFALLHNDYKLDMNPTTVLPLSLLLIDDFHPGNKLKGLNCCSSVLLCLKNNSFKEGNFYEVIFNTLLKAITEKDIEVTSLVLETLVQLLTILPDHAKKHNIDKAFATILDQIVMESNLYRKAACLNFVASIIDMHGINCINKKSFKAILCDSFEECTNEAVAEILLPSAIEVLENWIQHCWCIWRLSSDQKLLSILFKILYITREQSFVVQIHNLIIMLIGLCTKKEQKIIYESLQQTPDIKNEEFLERLEKIKEELSV